MKEWIRLYKNSNRKCFLVKIQDLCHYVYVAYTYISMAPGVVSSKYLPKN